MEMGEISLEVRGISLKVVMDGHLHQKPVQEKDDKREGMQMNHKSLVCYVCKGRGHKSFQCPNRVKGFVKQTAAAIRVHENNPIKKRTTQDEVTETQRQESAEERVVIKENEQGRDGENVVTGSAISDYVSNLKE